MKTLKQYILENQSELDKELQYHFKNNESLKKDILWMFDKMYELAEYLEEEDDFVDQVLDDHYWENDTELNIRDRVMDYLKRYWEDGWDNQTASRMFEIWEVYIKQKENEE